MQVAARNTRYFEHVCVCCAPAPQTAVNARSNFHRVVNHLCSVVFVEGFRLAAAHMYGLKPSHRQFPAPAPSFSCSLRAALISTLHRSPQPRNSNHGRPRAHTHSGPWPARTGSRRRTVRGKLRHHHSHGGCASSPSLLLLRSSVSGNPSSAHTSLQYLEAPKRSSQRPCTPKQQQQGA
jgi:hypothetical protein